jgi:hypothetical protein
MMKFASNNSNQFDLPKVAWWVGFMQLLGGFLCEVACIVFLSTINETIDVIIKFLALSSISKIDDFYAAALPAENKVVKNKMKANGCMINDRHRRNINDHPRSMGIKVAGVITKLLRIWYCSYIYYFIPFTVLILPYFSKSNTDPTTVLEV